MSDIKFGKYIEKNSEIHKMNALIKLLCLFIFSILIFISNSLNILITLSIVLLIMLLLSNLNFKILFYNYKLIIMFSILILLVNYISKINIEISLLYILKVYLLIIYSSLFTFSTKPKDINYAITKILKFFKVKNRNNISITIMLSFRFLPLLFENLKKIDKKKYIKSIGNIINVSLKKSDDIADVLYLRFYDLSENNNKQKIFIRDYYILFVHIFLIILRGVL